MNFVLGWLIGICVTLALALKFKRQIIKFHGQAHLTASPELHNWMSAHCTRREIQAAEYVALGGANETDRELLRKVAARAPQDIADLILMALGEYDG